VSSRYYDPQGGRFISADDISYLDPETIGGTATISIIGAQLVGIATGLVGIVFMSKPNSGRIRFSDGTGLDPTTGKEFVDPDRARNFYKTIKDAVKKANWKKWLKGKGWYRNHLK